MANLNCMYCKGTGFRNNGYYQYHCQCNQQPLNNGILPQINGTVLNGIAPYEYTKNNNKRKTELHNAVVKFMKENKITCEESIYQCNWVMENAYEFIEQLFNIVKDDLDIEDDQNES